MELLTFRTSCNDDMLPKGLGDLGSDGGCSRGLDGATRLAPVIFKYVIEMIYCSNERFTYHCKTG